MDIVTSVQVMGTGEWSPDAKADEGMRYKGGALARFADLYDETEGQIMRVALAEPVAEVVKAAGVYEVVLSVAGQAKAFDAGDRGLQVRQGYKLRINKAKPVAASQKAA